MYELSLLLLCCCLLRVLSSFTFFLNFCIRFFHFLVFHSCFDTNHYRLIAFLSLNLFHGQQHFKSLMPYKNNFGAFAWNRTSHLRFRGKIVLRYFLLFPFLFLAAVPDKRMLASVMSFFCLTLLTHCWSNLIFRRTMSFRFFCYVAVC